MGPFVSTTATAQGDIAGPPTEADQATSISQAIGFVTEFNQNVLLFSATSEILFGLIAGTIQKTSLNTGQISVLLENAVKVNGDITSLQNAVNALQNRPDEPQKDVDSMTFRGASPSRRGYGSQLGVEGEY